MTALSLVLSIVLGLAINEVSDVSPWLARVVVRWSARLRYGETTRAEIRAEELAAVINDRPGKLLKVVIAFRFLSAALAARVRRLLGGEASADEAMAGIGSVSQEEVSALVARYLFPTERFRGEWRRHWVHPVKSLLTGSIMCGLAIAAAWRQIDHRYAGWVIAGVIVTFAGWVAVRLANWYFQRFVVTNKRLMTAQGLFYRRVNMIPLLRVTDMRYQQSPLGRMLSYGTFQLEGVGRWNPMRTIKDLPNPNELYLRIVEEMYEPEAVEARIGYVPADDDTGLGLDPNFDLEDWDQGHPDGSDPLPVALTPPAPMNGDAMHHLVEQLTRLTTQLTMLAATVERLQTPPRSRPAAPRRTPGRRRRVTPGQSPDRR